MTGPERVVVLVNELTVRGRLRLQKYGFIAAHLYKNDLQNLDFYHDWVPYHYGPYSHDLAEDVQTCVDANILDEMRQTTQDGHTLYVYALKPKGRKILRELSSENGSVIKDLYNKFVRLNKKRLQDLLKDVYDAYSKYTTNSLIKNGLFKSDADNVDDYERFVPEIEETLKSIESGTYVAETYTPDEFLKYMKKVFEE